eukprot:SAG31_NODE_31603_length_366_cov_0.775281_1_plen_98_part_10
MGRHELQAVVAVAAAQVLALLPVPPVSGHGAVVVPKPRNALEGGLNPWNEPLKWPIEFADTVKQTPFCPVGIGATDHQNFSGVLSRIQNRDTGNIRNH